MSDGCVRIVRLLHFSDMHFSQSQVQSKYLRGALTLGKGIAPNLSARLAQGLAGHLSGVLKDLRESIVDYVAGYCGGEWSSDTHLLCTGDLTTWGDDPSLASALRFISKVHSEAALPTEPIILYGNHDVWPERPGHLRGLPFFSTQTALDQRRTEMRQQHFSNCSWLRTHLLLPGPPRVGLFSLNTVEHCRYWNTVARGTVQVDGYWEGTTAPEQLEQLEDALRDVDVALVFTHHPVYDDQYHWVSTSRQSTNPPPSAVPRSPRPHHPVLGNAPQVSHVLHATKAPGKSVRFVVSGHTHSVYPLPGQLPARGPLNHGFLKGNCGQLTVGTASQAAVSSAPAVDHSWQALSLWFDPQQNEVILERTVFGRQVGNGFAAYGGAPHPMSTAEHLRLSLA